MHNFVSDRTLNFFSAIVKSLAWPVVILWLGYLFRGVIDGVQLHQIKKGDWQVDFTSVATEVRADIGMEAHEANEVHLGSAELSTSVKLFPTLVIAQKWNELENSIAAVAQRAGITEQRLTLVLRELERRRTILPSTRDAVLGLWSLRNLAVHAPAAQVTVQRAGDFTSMANAILLELSTVPASSAEKYEPDLEHGNHNAQLSTK